MKILNNIFQTFINLPNLPFIIIFTIYLVIMVTRKTSTEEIALMSEEEIDKSIKGIVNKLYPNHLRYFIACFIYLSLFLYL